MSVIGSMSLTLYSSDIYSTFQVHTNSKNVTMDVNSDGSVGERERKYITRDKTCTTGTTEKCQLSEKKETKRIETRKSEAQTSHARTL